MKSLDVHRPVSTRIRLNIPVFMAVQVLEDAWNVLRLSFGTLRDPVICPICNAQSKQSSYVEMKSINRCTVSSSSVHLDR